MRPRNITIEVFLLSINLTEPLPAIYRPEKALAPVQSYEHDPKRYFRFLIRHAEVHDIVGLQ